MGKKVFVMPDEHFYKKEYIGYIVKELIDFCDKRIAESRTEPFKQAVLEKILTIKPDKFTWENYPKIVEGFSRDFHVGNYSGKARIIEAAKPDVLLLENVKSERDILNQIPFVDADYVVGALNEIRSPYATRKPIYEVCKNLNIKAIPIDDDKLVKEWNTIADKRNELFYLRSIDESKNAEFQAINEEYERLVRKRSEFMLNEMGRNMDELGTGNNYVALVGEQHYKDFLEIPQKDVEILHINKRLEELGAEIRYNESDY